ncbi:hypothetical protein R3W88_033828 [Solanum pinnatisectum]|uniref:Retrotransposon gag domain-containing protein n=1 Tax=Solanum pinnatisectum TaxID=50273 RepID=A0AAV9JZX2_9SOLN|nr:hypothetical protein R3W88_033828 [Solanum pinnatisectum]
MLAQLVAARCQPVAPDVAGPYEGLGSSRVREFLALNPPKFTGTDSREYPQHFVDQLHRIFIVMHASATELVGLIPFQLRDVAVLWYESWERSRGKDASLPTWDSFTEAFIDHYLTREIRDSRVDQFLNLRQGSMSGGPRPQYSIRPPIPPPQQFQGSRFDRQGQSGPCEDS